MKKKKIPKIMIGWKEWCGLPLLGLPAVRAKIDTGARTSALHAFDIEAYEEKSLPFVRFRIHPLEGSRSVSRICIAPLLQTRIIISSNGERELRPVIMTDFRMGEIIFTTELTLTSRHKMNFRMLLGRKALRKARFTVDPVKSFLLGRQLDPEKLYADTFPGA